MLLGKVFSSIFSATNADDTQLGAIVKATGFAKLSILPHTEECFHF